ncbi:TPA: hypothetical protein EYP13_04225 [Candidatus Micrarchaeota archaeon]|nr:hypothetical protein [Candidatus Micrarchaeota archaeon]
MLVPKNLLRDVDWKYFQIIFKKSTQGIIQYNFYTNEKEFDKELTYKLATKDDSFDFAIVPAYWFNHLNKLANISFKIS